MDNNPMISWTWWPREARNATHNTTIQTFSSQFLDYIEIFTTCSCLYFGGHFINTLAHDSMLGFCSVFEPPSRPWLRVPLWQNVHDEWGPHCLEWFDEVESQLIKCKINGILMNPKIAVLLILPVNLIIWHVLSSVLQGICCEKEGKHKRKEIPP